MENKIRIRSESEYNDNRSTRFDRGRSNERKTADVTQTALNINQLTRTRYTRNELIENAPHSAHRR